MNISKQSSILRSLPSRLSIEQLETRKRRTNLKKKNKKDKTKTKKFLLKKIKTKQNLGEYLQTSKTKNL